MAGMQARDVRDQNWVVVGERKEQSLPTVKAEPAACPARLRCKTESQR